MSEAAEPAGGRGVAPAHRRSKTDAGSLSLELALALPVLTFALLAIVYALVFAAHSLIVQEAARAGARAAATNPTDFAVVRAARLAAEGRPVRVVVTPARRRPGQTAVVTVHLDASAGPISYTVTGRAVAQVEPVVGR